MFYLSNRPQVVMVYRLINYADVGRTRGEFVNHEPGLWPGTLCSVCSWARHLWSLALTVPLLAQVNGYHNI